MNDSRKIQDFWDSRATAEVSYKSSWEDYYMVEKEIFEISKYIAGNEKICDFGCNNGYGTFRLLSLFEGIEVDGIDYSENLIKVAKEALISAPHAGRARFSVGNILDPASYPEKKYDIILLKRILINLETPENQIRALSSIEKLLKTGGKIILSEAVEENWRRLNQLRHEFGLEELGQPWHNCYLKKDVIDFMYTHFQVEIDDDYSSSYYLISRVLNPWIQKLNDVKKLDYLSEINRMAATLPNFGDYGTQRLLILKPRKYQ